MKIASIALASLLLLSASASAEEPVKIGFISTFSGPSGQLGQELLDGFNLGIKSVGGKLGGRAVEVIKGDDQAKPDVGRQLADKMIESDRVQIITGINFSNVMLAVAKPVLDSGAFIFSVNAGPSQYAGKLCNAHYFNESFQNDTLPEAMGLYLKSKQAKRVYLMAPNYPAGKDFSPVSNVPSRGRSPAKYIRPLASSTTRQRSRNCAPQSPTPFSSSIRAEWGSISSSSTPRPG